MEARKEMLPQHVSKMSMSLSPIVRRASVGRGSSNISVRASPVVPTTIGGLQLPTFGMAQPTRLVATPSAAAGRSFDSSLMVSSPKKTSVANTRAAFLASDSDND